MKGGGAGLHDELRAEGDDASEPERKVLVRGAEHSKGMEALTALPMVSRPLDARLFGS